MKTELILENLPIENIPALEKIMLGHDQVDCPVIHRFSPGIYIREVSLPAGAIAIGHYQKTRHLNVFLQGMVTMFNDDGSRTDLEAPMMFTGEPGRKVGYIHENVVWLNIYPTDETDIETLESMYLDKSEAFLEHLPEIDRTRDRDDYQQVIKETGFTDEIVKEQTENPDDQIPIPEGSYKFLIGDSDIHGKGVFATALINKGESIGPARIKDKRTPLGRFTNHAKTPNAKMIVNGSDIILVASRDIDGCKGGLNGEEITTDYRDNITTGESLCQA